MGDKIKDPRRNFRLTKRNRMAHESMCAQQRDYRERNTKMREELRDARSKHRSLERKIRMLEDERLAWKSKLPSKPELMANLLEFMTDDVKEKDAKLKAIKSAGFWQRVKWVITGVDV